MKQSKRTERNIGKVLLGLATGLVLALIGNNTAQAYELYADGCNDCHGNFDSSTSPKGTQFPSNSNHTMHNGSSSMNTECELCHTGDPDNALVYLGSSDGIGTVAGLGCSGCHVGSGLRKHHAIRGETACYSGGAGCHGTGASDNPPAENVISPPYYGTAYTQVQNPSNTVQVANINENWSVGDFVGLDNDGNGLADLADYTIGPRERILSASREGNNLRVTWQTAGGRTNTVQAAGTVTGTYTNLSSAIKISGAGLVTTNYLEVGGATSNTRFYRTRSQVP
jgi:hypothetical protein